MTAANSWERNIAAVKERGIKPLLARPSDSDHGTGLGTTRWVVEAALAWYNNHRRLRVCYERTPKSFQGFHELASLLICFNRLAPHLPP